MKKNLIKNSAGILAICFMFYSTGVVNVFGDFFRTAGFPFSAPSNNSEFQYGYGYGDLGWGYGYGYGYGYGADQAGYYYSEPTTGTESFSNPKIVTPSTITSVSTISGNISAASSVTIKTASKLSISDVEVVLPAGLVITSSDNSTFDFTTLTGTTTSISDLTDTTGTPVEFGVSGKSLKFSKPVQIKINVGTNNVVYPRVKHFGGSWSIDGLTTNASSTCTDGVSSDPLLLSTQVTPSSNIITLYTCKASTFSAVSTYTATTTTTSGGGGGGGYYNPNPVNLVTTASPSLKATNTINNATAKLAAKNPKLANLGIAITKAYKDMLIFDASLSTEFVTNYSLLAEAMSSDDKAKLKIAVDLFKKSYKEYLVYKKANIVKKSITISGKKVTLETPVYKDAKFAKSVEKVNAKILKVMNKVPASNISDAMNAYNRFLLSLKVLKESNGSKELVLEIAEEFKNAIKK